MVTFVEVVLKLIEKANSLWVEIAPDNPEQYGNALSSNIAALQLIDRAMKLVNRKVSEIRGKYPRSQFPWNTSMMYSVSWELIPGLHSTQHSFTPFEAEESGNELEASLRRRGCTLFIGDRGQGKTLMARYTTGKLFLPTIYIDCSQDFEHDELENVLSDSKKSVIVLDEPAMDAADFVEAVVTKSDPSNAICVIASSDNPCTELFGVAMKEVRLEKPTDFEIWRLRQRFASSFFSSYLDLPPCDVKNRGVIIRSIQDYILQSMSLLGKLQTVDREDPRKTGAPATRPLRTIVKPVPPPVEQNVPKVVETFDKGNQADDLCQCPPPS